LYWPIAVSLCCALRIQQCDTWSLCTQSTSRLNQHFSDW
jgi:hypothetical protein